MRIQHDFDYDTTYDELSDEFCEHNSEYQANTINEIGLQFKIWSQNKKRPATYVQMLEIAEQLNDYGKWFIETICEYMDGKAESEECKELQNAVDMAIEGLLAEPCEDVISRQAVNDLQKYRYNCGDTGITCVSLASINKLLPVTPQPKIGHWIRTLEDWNKWECSECGFTKRTDVHVRIGYKYCPNCGCCMESEVSDVNSD